MDVLTSPLKNLYENNDAVINLNTRDFDLKNKKILNDDFKGKQGLFVVYAPWCQHCKEMSDMWKELANLYKYRFPIGAINSDDYSNRNEEVVHKLKVKYYPTFKFIDKNGKIKNFKGKTNKDDLIYFIESNSF